MPFPGSGHPKWITPEMLEDGRRYPRMKGKQVFKNAVEKIPQVIKEALDHNQMALEDISLFIFHQANLRIIERVATTLGIPADKVYNNIQEYGNTTAASIPIALHEALGKGYLKKGQYAMMATFGAGLTWASAIMKW